MKLKDINYLAGIDRTVIGLWYPTIAMNELEKLDEHEKAIMAYAQKQFLAKKMYVLENIKGCAKFEKITKNKFLHRYLIKAEDGEVAFEVQIGKLGPSHVVNFQFNPTKLTPEGRVELENFIDISFSYGYHELFGEGRVSHIELYIDVLDMDLKQYQLIDFGRRVRTDFGTTQYHGRRSSPLTIAMYDKGEQLNSEKNHWRIEARVKDRGRSLHDFIDAPPPNPFQNFCMIEKEKLKSIANSFGGKSLYEKLLALGFYEAVKNPSARKNLEAMISASKAEWWDIDTIYSLHKEALEQLRPNAIFSQ